MKSHDLDEEFPSRFADHSGAFRIHLGVGQNPVPPMTLLKNPLKGGNLPNRYPVGFNPQPFTFFLQTLLGKTSIPVDGRSFWKGFKAPARDQPLQRQAEREMEEEEEEEREQQSLGFHKRFRLCSLLWCFELLKDRGLVIQVMVFVCFSMGFT